MAYLNDLEVHKRQQDQQLTETEETCGNLGIYINHCLHTWMSSVCQKRRACISYGSSSLKKWKLCIKICFLWRDLHDMFSPVFLKKYE